jgi:hypothetical protein
LIGVSTRGPLIVNRRPTTTPHLRKDLTSENFEAEKQISDRTRLKTATFARSLSAFWRVKPFQRPDPAAAKLSCKHIRPSVARAFSDWACPSRPQANPGPSESRRDGRAAPGRVGPCPARSRHKFRQLAVHRYLARGIRPAARPKARCPSPAKSFSSAPRLGGYGRPSPRR